MCKTPAKLLRLRHKHQTQSEQANLQMLPQRLDRVSHEAGSAGSGVPNTGDTYAPSNLASANMQSTHHCRGSVMLE